MQSFGKVAIVTGAGSGMGADEGEGGAKVVLTDLTAAAGRDVAPEIGGDAVFVEHDVSSEGSVQGRKRILNGIPIAPA
ncbi:hypothetical protein [Sphingomonas sp. Leaf412]|uniref:hypothetical protein n=1 Tax=Sphingomonas sp. Leaf412 TaxID=1736370 RepID=UPI001911034A|nr:hypothetical protein [Sphingomonas sp. Leaf412]